MQLQRPGISRENCNGGTNGSIAPFAHVTSTSATEKALQLSLSPDKAIHDFEEQLLDYEDSTDYETEDETEHEVEGDLKEQSQAQENDEEGSYEDAGSSDHENVINYSSDNSGEDNAAQTSGDVGFCDVADKDDNCEQHDAQSQLHQEDGGTHTNEEAQTTDLSTHIREEAKPESRSKRKITMSARAAESAAQNAAFTKCEPNSYYFKL